MTESQFMSKLLKRLREHPRLKDCAVIFKHANYFTKGVPDFSVTIGARTTWWEVKRWAQNPTKIQCYFLNRIADGAALIRMSRDGKQALVSYIEHIGYLTIDELVEEIVARSLPL